MQIVNHNKLLIPAHERREENTPQCDDVFINNSV